MAVYSIQVLYSIIYSIMYTVYSIYASELLESWRCIGGKAAIDEALLLHTHSASCLHAIGSCLEHGYMYCRHSYAAIISSLALANSLGYILHMSCLYYPIYMYMH